MRRSSEWARDRFDEARVARLATADASGRPHLVPIVFARVGDRLVSAVDGKPKSGAALRRLELIAQNPQVSVLVDGYDEDWTQLWWARADGHADIRAIESGPDANALLAALVDRYPQYRGSAPIALPGPLLVIDVARWSGWSASELP